MCKWNRWRGEIMKIPAVMESQWRATKGRDLICRRPEVNISSACCCLCTTPSKSFTRVHTGLLSLVSLRTFVCTSAATKASSVTPVAECSELTLTSSHRHSKVRTWIRFFSLLLIYGFQDMLSSALLCSPDCSCQAQLLLCRSTPL